MEAKLSTRQSHAVVIAGKEKRWNALIVLGVGERYLSFVVFDLAVRKCTGALLAVGLGAVVDVTRQAAAGARVGPDVVVVVRLHILLGTATKVAAVPVADLAGLGQRFERRLRDVGQF